MMTTPSGDMRVDTSGGYRYRGLFIAWQRREEGWLGYMAVARDGLVLVTWERGSNPQSRGGW